MGLTVRGKFPDTSEAAKKLLAAAPTLVANEAKNHFLKGFKKGGGQTDASLGGWKQRKRKDPKRQKGKRAILIKTGAMRNDIDIRKTTLEKIVLGTLDTNYASYHNEGAKNLPQRQFLGNSRKLNAAVVKLLDKQFKKYFDG